MKRRLSHTEPEDEPENTLPLINIVFLLLIFFMIAGAIEKADLFDIVPPNSQALNQKQGEPLEISLSHEGQFGYQGREYSAEDVLSVLETETDRTQTLEIKADAALDTQQLLDFLSKVKLLNFSKVTLLVTAQP